MVDPIEQAKVIIAERSDLRSEIIQMVKSMHQAVFAFVSVSVMVVGLYLKKDIIQDDETRMWFLFFLTQVLVYLEFVMVILTANHNVHAGYIEALERKLNSIFNSNVSIWEHQINPRFMVSAKCSFGLSLIVLDSFIFIGQIYFIVVAFREEKELYGAILIIELVFVLLLLLYSFVERGWVSSFAEEKFKPKCDAPPVP